MEVSFDKHLGPYTRCFFKMYRYMRVIVAIWRHFWTRRPGPHRRSSGLLIGRLLLSLTSLSFVQLFSATIGRIRCTLCYKYVPIPQRGDPYRRTCAYRRLLCEPNVRFEVREKRGIGSTAFYWRWSFCRLGSGHAFRHAQLRTVRVNDRQR